MKARAAGESLVMANSVPPPRTGLPRSLAGVGREVEEVRVRAELGAVGEEGRDERRLTVHVALGRRGEEALRAVAEVGGRHRRGAAVDELVVLGEPAELVDRLDHARVVELDGVVDPAVIDVRRVEAQHEVLDPVGRRPAGRRTRAEADAPRGAAVLDDLLGQRLQVFHRLRNLVAGFREVIRHVPDQALQVGLPREGDRAASCRPCPCRSTGRPTTDRRRSCRAATAWCRRRAG